jgi:hypothetical protein
MLVQGHTLAGEGEKGIEISEASKVVRRGDE